MRDDEIDELLELLPRREFGWYHYGHTSVDHAEN